MALRARVGGGGQPKGKEAAYLRPPMNGSTSRIMKSAVPVNIAGLSVVPPVASAISPIGALASVPGVERHAVVSVTLTDTAEGAMTHTKTRQFRTPARDS